jgi:3-oxoacyl-[acyl-carrier-protein] synthase II
LAKFLKKHGMKKRIVITGIGIISPFGLGKDIFWENIKIGRSAIKQINRFDTSKLKSKFGALISDEIENDFNHDPKIMRLQKISKWTVTAAQMALKDAQLNLRKIDLQSIGIFYGSGNGSIEATEKIETEIIKGGINSVDPLAFQESVFNAPISHLSILLGIKGPNIVSALGPASGANALSLALDNFENETIEYALVGAADEVTPLIMKGYQDLKIISPEKNTIEGSYPYDQRANGLVIGEGAVFLVLEKNESALKRKTAIFGEILSAAETQDAYKNADNNPNGEGIKQSMQNAIIKAKVTPQEIDAIFGFAQGRKKIDLLETKGIIGAFNGFAKKIPVISLKGALGETSGPSGLLNLCTALFCFQESFLPPTANLEKPAPGCVLDYVPQKGREKKIKVILSNSFCWGGIYNSTCLKKWES